MFCYCFVAIFIVFEQNIIVVVVFVCGLLFAVIFGINVALCYIAINYAPLLFLSFRPLTAFNIVTAVAIFIVARTTIAVAYDVSLY